MRFQMKSPISAQLPCIGSHHKLHLECTNWILLHEIKGEDVLRKIT